MSMTGVSRRGPHFLQLRPEAGSMREHASYRVAIAGAAILPVAPTILPLGMPPPHRQDRRR